ncbi:MAG: rhomboid family intramembrane serine protease [Sedimentisphaerales bacterium]|nr:rhomboid family intramembrane serine protease [Sedimentisphaerales bacterium]
MFLLFPVGTDNPLRRRPVMNYALILANVVLFLLTYRALTGEAAPRHYHNFGGLLLHPDSPQLYQFITYAFLHGGWMHLIGNMLFLYIFGNSVNDRLGHIGYLFLYLAGGIFSGIGHALLSSTPVLGASGAVAAVTGAYMVLFPHTNIFTFYWLFLLIGTAQFPALYFILFKLIIYDNMIEPRLGGPANVAYMAHLAGYGFGIVIPLLLIAIKMLPHSPYDLWALVKRWQRRQKYQRVVQEGYDPYSPVSSERKFVKSKVLEPRPPDPHTQEVMDLRIKVSQTILAGDLTTAADLYLKLLSLDPEQILPEQQQLDIANKLMQMGRHTEAARAYESFIGQYPKYPFLEQVQLMLGLIYSRYLDRKDLARKHLEAAEKELSNENQRRMCQEELQLLD